MAYSSEVVRRARQRLAEAKAEKEFENQAHLRIAYEKIPRLKEIDLQLRKTMALAAQAVFTSGGDVEAAMEKVRQENLSLQQERKMLIDANFPAGYLDEAPVCSHCGGSGYVGSTMCSCLRELCRQEQKKELTLLNVGDVSFDQFRLDYYPDRVDPKLGVNIRSLMEKNFKTCRNYAYGFSEKSENLLFSGGTGLGKTFLSACIARTVADNGYSVVYETAGHMFGKLERAKFDSDEGARLETGKYTSCDLLIIDDLGTELGGNFVTTVLYSLINDRLLSGKPTIISTNLTNEELESRYSGQIVSRLRGAYRRIPFLGDDIRVKRNWER